ncbi:MAG: hypothetical protein CMM55_10780 [Rhodospirillaceae bacterium]|nr:hypothetical protein [Rhodospirillaceae bacterium]
MIRAFFLNSLAAVIATAFARYQWNRFRHATLPLSDWMLADIGVNRTELYKASTAEEYISRNGAW